MGSFASVANWLSQPYKNQGNAFDWFLFVGLIVVSLILWRIIITDIMREV